MAMRFMREDSSYCKYCTGIVRDGGASARSSVHRGQAHLVYDRLEARIGMNKIKVRIVWEMHQEWRAFLVSSLQVADRFIFAPESGIAKGELDWRNVFCCRSFLNVAEIPLQLGPEAAPAECPLHFCGTFLVSPEQQRP